MSGFMIAALVIGAGAGVYGADQQRSSNNKALDLQKKQMGEAAKQAELQKQQFNRANGKSANADEFLSENVKQARKGVSGTILTSPTGVAGQTLGGTSLLGG